LNVSAQVLASDMILLLPPERFVLERLETVDIVKVDFEQCDRSGLDELVQRVKRERKLTPNLIVQILRLVNSSAFNFQQPIASVRDAVAAIGTRQIMRWAQLLLFAHGRQRPMQADPLIQLAGARARFMELTAAARYPCQEDLPDAAFMTGIFAGPRRVRPER
jgi:c-di-GMP-related signal transduction protein